MSDEKGSSSSNKGNTSSDPQVNQTPTPKSEKDTLLAKIKEVTEGHVAITSEFTTLQAATTPLPDWPAFGLKVDAAFAKLKDAVALLSKYKVSSGKPDAGDTEANDAVFGEYEKLYTAITKALVDGEGKIKGEVETSNFQSLIFTQEFLGSYNDSDTEENPINKFIMAIKDYSYNSNANKINSSLNIPVQESSNLNHALLKAVLDALAPESAKRLLSSSTSLKDLATLLKELTPMFTSATDTALKKKINNLFMPGSSEHGGGGSSSSSSSKKNRKSHKSYHPDIGKTRKHHYNADHKRVSFVHQA